MPETRNRILQVDATIELKDYFQACLDAFVGDIIVSKVGPEAKLLK
jgi:hypothetical protein